MNANDLPAEVRDSLEQLANQAGEIAADTQSLSHELHSARLEYLGIAAAVKGFCREFSEKQHMEIDFKSHDVPASLPPDISLCLFRVLQEALHNSAKHSGTQSFVVSLWGTPDEICLSVRDSGAGFDSETVKEGHGHWPHQHGRAFGPGEWDSLHRFAPESRHYNLRSCPAQCGRRFPESHRVAGRFFCSSH